MTKKILFLHGFFTSGSCIPAQAFRQAFMGKAEVFTPDLPLHPKEALEFIEDICQQEKPYVLVGNSNGASLAQIVASRLGLPALLGNPYLEMTCFLIERIGEHEYKSPRADGRQHFIIDQSLIEEFADVQAHQWDAYHTRNWMTVSGDYSAEMTIWHILNHCSANTIRTSITSPVPIRLQQKRYGSIMCRWRKNLYNTTITNRYVKSKTEKIPSNTFQRASYRSDA